MKTTIEIDEVKLKRVMRWTGLKTRRKAVDFALSTTEKAVQLDQLLSSSLYEGASGPIVDPSYDVERLRGLDKPGKR